MSRVPRTITPSQKRRANEEPSPPTRRAPSKKTRRPPVEPLSSTASEESSDDDLDLPPSRLPPAKPRLDPADCEFFVQHTIYLDNNRLKSTTKTYKLGLLTFPHVWQSSVDLVKEAAGVGVETLLVSSIATITASRTKPMMPDIKTRMDWNDIEGIIEKLFMEKKDSLAIDWSVKYKTKSVPPPLDSTQTPSQQRPTSSAMSSNSQNVPRRVSP